MEPNKSRKQPKIREIQGRFWSELLELNENTIMPAIYTTYEQTGRIHAFTQDRKKGSWYTPHVFWDSDVAKWMEAAGYVLERRNDHVLLEKMEWLIDQIEKNRDEQGYFNTYFQTMEPDQKWQRIDDHELYCAGHLLEAAIAYYQATGRDRFLRIMQDFMQHIEEVFFTKKTAGFDVPGHQQIELALVRLYDLTQDPRYIKMAFGFLERRGKNAYGSYEDRYDQTATQQHAPVLMQEQAIGHAVRATYQYTAMADVAYHMKNEAYRRVVDALWRDITDAKMFVTGGVGTSHSKEAYTYAYDLPAEYGYTETCASIGLFFFGARLMHDKPKVEYADVMERAFYNTILGSVSSDGTTFFYSNPLAVDERLVDYLSILRKNRMEHRERVLPAIERKKDLGCMCCPANVSRLIASFHTYAISVKDDAVMLHMPVGLTADVRSGVLTVESEYPLESDFLIKYTGQTLDKSLMVRVPSWCAIQSIQINGVAFEADRPMDNNYIRFPGPIADQTEIFIQTDMQPHLVRAHPSVKDCAGRVAVMKGPFVYVLEAMDHTGDLHAISMDVNKPLLEQKNPKRSWHASSLAGQGRRPMGTKLYTSEIPAYEPVDLHFIPFYARMNREKKDMIVWVLEQKL